MFSIDIISTPQALCCAVLESKPEYEALCKAAGDFEIAVEKCNNAYTDFKNKRIVLDPSLFRDKVGDLYPKAMESLVFELANLSQALQFKTLHDAAGTYTPDQLVERFERLEHGSALKAKEILRKYLPRAQWDSVPLAYIPHDFESHYSIQQIKGHSRRIWNRYAHLFPQQSYRGTLGIQIPEEEKRYLLAVIDLHSRLGDSDETVQQFAKKNLDRLLGYCSARSVEESGNGLFSRVLDHSAPFLKSL